MPASIATRLDEQEFLELADFYYVADSRPEMTDNLSRTGSTTTFETHHRHRATTPGPRWRPSTLIECDDSGPASTDVDAYTRYNFVEGQTIVIDPRPTSKPILLDYDSDDSQSFCTAKEHDLGKPSDGFLRTVRPRIQMPQIDPVIRSSSSISRKKSRPISTASFVPGSCFGVISFPRWNVKGFYHSTGSRQRKQKKVQPAQSIRRGKGENPGSLRDFSIISLDHSQSPEDCFISSPPRGLASASSPFFGLDYDYHLAVDVLINGSQD